MNIEEQHYYLVEKCDKKEFEDVIHRCITKYGFAPTGGVSTYTKDGLVAYCQAMYKEPKKDNDPLQDSKRLKSGMAIFHQNL